MSEQEIAQAFHGNESAQWWRALVQVMEATRQDYIERTFGGVDKNNSLAMARDIGAFEGLTALLDLLGELVVSGKR